MTARFATQLEVDQWDNHIIANPDSGNIFQTKEFGSIKSTNNWNAIYAVIDEIYILILERKIPILGNFWYTPKGPGITSVENLKKLIPEFRDFARQNNVFAIKFEPELLETPIIVKDLKKLKLKKSKNAQAANTVIVDISKSIEEITASFSSKVRGNIRAAQKANVTTEIVPISDKNCSFFYEMMKQTINGRSHVRKPEYYYNYWQTHYRAGTGLFMFAKIGNEVLSMDFITVIGSKAARKDAASTRDHSVRGASSLLEMAAIEYLKSINIKEYDLYGAPPSSQIKNPKHPFYGFGTFKVGFNPQVTDYVGCYDLAVKPTAYKFWQKYGERITRRIYYILHHDLYY
jgi:lipid II:glycine glycyltransferase (peptidoglycan interpeptide bridge formation enzyme)